MGRGQIYSCRTFKNKVLNKLKKHRSNRTNKRSVETKCQSSTSVEKGLQAENGEVSVARGKRLDLEQSDPAQTDVIARLRSERDESDRELWVHFPRGFPQ